MSADLFDRYPALLSTVFEAVCSCARRALLFGAVLGILTNTSPALAAPTCVGPALAFRLDDVQDYWLSEAQRAVIELFANQDVPLTLAVIGGFFGEDETLVTTIKRYIDRVEIANHGLHAENNLSGESILLTQDDALTKRQIREASLRIKRLLGTVPNVFIPHKNQFNSDLLQTLGALEFDYISSACSRHIETPLTCEDACGYPNELSCGEPDPHGLVHVPVGASTRWEPAPGRGSASPEVVLDEIRRSTDRYGFAVVMLHPQDFVYANQKFNPNALTRLGELLSKLRDAGTHNLVRLSKVSRSCGP